MENEVICTGDDGKGTYCSDCGKYRGNHIMPEIYHPCFKCGSKKITIRTNMPLVIVKLMEINNDKK